MKVWKRYQLQRSFITRLRINDAEAMTQVHARAFARAWSQTEFEGLFNQPSVQAMGMKIGKKLLAFVLTRTAADEAEILTLATHPSWRRLQIGEKVLRQGLSLVASYGAVKCFLEVEENNTGAVRLYEKSGFVITGRRSSYYRSEGGGDALMMTRALK